MIHTAVTSTAYGSVVIGVDMNVSDAEKELARLKKNVIKLEGDIGEKTFKTDVLKERLHQANKEYESIQKILEGIDSRFYGDREKKSIEQMAELEENIKSWSTEIEKLGKSIDDSNIALEFTKIRYGEIAQEARRLQQESEQTKAKSLESMAESAEIADRRIVELNKELSGLKARQRELGKAGVGFGYEEYDWNTLRIGEINRQIKDYQKIIRDSSLEQMSKEAENVKNSLYAAVERFGELKDQGISLESSKEMQELRREIKSCIHYLDEMAELGQLSQLSSGVEIAQERIADLTKSVATFERMMKDPGLTGEEWDRYSAKVDRGKKLIKDYQRTLDDLSSPEERRFLKGITDEAEVADQKIVDLNRELKDLKARQKELNEHNVDVGYVEYDQNAKRISEISEQVKEYQKQTTKTPLQVQKEMDQAMKAAENLTAEMEAAAKKEEEAAEEAERLKAIADSAEVSNQAIVDLNKELEELKQRQKELGEAGVGLGHEEYDRNASRIAEINRELKEYQKSLSSTTAQNIEPQIAGPISKSSIAAEKMNLVLSKSRKLLKTAGTAGVKAFRAVGKAIGNLSKTFLMFGKNAVSFIKKFNVFSKLTDALNGKFKRIGSTIKSALVFSVIYKGLSLLREQMGAYLNVNTQFMTALRRLQGVLLTAFQPIYEVVVPALTTLINVLARAAATVTQFFASLFGTTAKQAQTNAKDLYEQANATTAAGDAAEEASKQLAGFDEINKLEGSKSAGGGGSTSVDTGPLFDYEYDETPFDTWGEAFSAFLDKLLAGIPKLREAFQKFADWLNDWSKKVYDMFTFPGVLDKVKQLGHDLADALNELVNRINWYQLGQALGAGLNLALNFLTSFLYEFDWMNLGSRLAEFINGLVSEIDWYEFGRLLWAGFKIGLETLAGFILGLDMPQLAEAASNIVIGFFDEMKNTINRIPWKEIGAQIARFLNNIQWYEIITSAAAAISAAINALFTTVRGFIDELRWSEIATQIYTAINDSLGQIKWREIGETIGAAFKRAFDFVREVVAGVDWTQIGVDIATFLNGIDWIGLLSSLAEAIASGINAAVHALGGLVANLDWSTIGVAIGASINKLVEDVDWAGIGKAFSDGLHGMITAAIDFVKTVDWLQLGLNIVDALKNIDWIGLLADVGILIGDLFCAALELAFAALKALNDIGIQIVAGILLGILNAMGSIVIWLYDNLVKPIIDGVKNLLGIHSPSTVFAEIGENLIAGLLQGITDTWNSIVEFFSEKVEALKKTLLDAWSNIKKDASEKWADIKKTLGDKWEEVKTSAKEKFEGVRQRVSEAWNNIKSDAPGKWEEIKTTLAAAWDKVRTTAEEKFKSIKEKIIEKMDEVKDKDWFQTGKTVVDGILSGLESIWNSLTSWAKNVKDTISDALSGASSARSGSFGSTRSGSFGGSSRIAVQSMPDIGNFEIPALAKGAVIPPNREFLAVLGDQRSGNNLEGPEDTFRQIVRDENAAMIGVLREILSAIRAGKEMTVDGDTFAKLVYSKYNSESSRKGVRLVEART